MIVNFNIFILYVSLVYCYHISTENLRKSIIDSLCVNKVKMASTSDFGPDSGGRMKVDYILKIILDCMLIYVIYTQIHYPQIY